MKVAFLVTELQEPVGGLYRFSVQFLKTWKELIKGEDVPFEPLVVSVKYPHLPKGDLKRSSEFPELEKRVNLKVWEGERGGVGVYFLESDHSWEEKCRIYKKLWRDYHIKSDAASSTPFYKKLTDFWIDAPAFLEEITKKENIALIDAQDWLAFPAGFLAKERINKPLFVRFHSGEFGRSMGNPNWDDAPIRIETAALIESDYVQGVSTHEAKFEIYHLLPFREKIINELKRYKESRWQEEQRWKTSKYVEFLLKESEDVERIGEVAAGVTNGIELKDWIGIEKEDVKNGEKILERIMPDKQKYILFLGRAERRKGIEELLKAMQLLKVENVGLIVFSHMSDEEEKNLQIKIRNLRIENKVKIVNTWIEAKKKMQLLCAADIIAVPSLYEPFGIITLEALAADLAADLNDKTGPAVVVGDTGGMSEIIRNGIDGFKSPMEFHKFKLEPVFLERILDMLLTNPELRKKIAENGARRVQAKYFNWKYIAKKIFEIYLKAIENYKYWR